LGEHRIITSNDVLDITEWPSCDISATLSRIPPVTHAVFESGFVMHGVESMADAKIEIKKGGFSFSGEGSKEWLSEVTIRLLPAAAC
jgi:hypothetical protein